MLVPGSQTGRNKKCDQQITRYDGTHKSNNTRIVEYQHNELVCEGESTSVPNLRVSKVLLELQHSLARFKRECSDSGVTYLSLEMVQTDLSYIPNLESPEQDKSCTTSPIVQMGNFFIMDSEKLRSNPIKEFLRRDALTEAQKRYPNREKLASFGHKTCGSRSDTNSSRLERDKTKTLRNLAESSFSLRHEVKLLDLDRQKNQVEVRRRMCPEEDLSVDVTRILNMEQRLGVNVTYCYLDRKLRYPTRIRSASDLGVPPSVLLARDTLRRRDLQRVSREPIGARSNRLHQDQFYSISLPTPTRVKVTNCVQSDSPATSPRIHGAKWQAACSRDNWLQHQNSVHFGARENIPVTLTLTVKNTKPETCGLDETRCRNVISGTSDVIDKTRVNNSNHSLEKISNNFTHSEKILETPHILPLRTHKIFPHRRSNDMIKTESRDISYKVQKFITELTGSGSYGDTKESDISQPPQDFHLRAENTKIKSRKLDKNPLFVVCVPDKAPDIDALTLEPPTAKVTGNADQCLVDQVIENKGHKLPVKEDKYSWRLIRGHPAVGLERGNSAGVQEISNVHRPSVPRHAAARAKRRTVTFRIFKVVERLAQERTRYQQHQVEELKRVMSSEKETSSIPALKDELSIPPT